MRNSAPTTRAQTTAHASTQTKDLSASARKVSQAFDVQVRHFAIVLVCTMCDVYDVIVDDVNECADGSHRCGVHGSCVNTFGSYDCECEVGYHGQYCGGLKSALKPRNYMKNASSLAVFLQAITATVECTWRVWKEGVSVFVR